MSPHLAELFERFPPEDLDEVEVWSCTDCGDFGAFGPVEYSG